MAEPKNFNNSTFNPVLNTGQHSKLPYKKPQLTRYGKLTELTRGGGAAKKDGGKKTKASGQA